MNLSFLDDIKAFAETGSLVVKVLVSSIVAISILVPPIALKIKESVEAFYDIFDKKEADSGTPVPKEEKREATNAIVGGVMEEFHGSGSLISESVARSLTGMFVYVIGAMRYGEDNARNEQAVIKGYMSKSEDIINAEKTHAGFKLFGV